MWSALAKAQLAAGLVSDAIASYIKAKDTTNYLDVIKACQDEASFLFHYRSYIQCNARRFLPVCLPVSWRFWAHRRSIDPH